MHGNDESFALIIGNRIRGILSTGPTGYFNANYKKVNIGFPMGI